MTWIPASWSRRASGRLSTRKSTSKLGSRTASSERMSSSSWQMASTRTSGQPHARRTPRDVHLHETTIIRRGTIRLQVPLAIRCVLLAAALAFWPPARVAGQPGLPSSACPSALRHLHRRRRHARPGCPAAAGPERHRDPRRGWPCTARRLGPDGGDSVPWRPSRRPVARAGARRHPFDPLTATTVVLDVRDSTLALDTLVFDLRSRLTALRAGAPGPVRLGVEPPAGAAEALGLLGAAGYWDVLVTSSPAGTAGGWKRGQPIVDAGRGSGRHAHVAGGALADDGSGR